MKYIVHPGTGTVIALKECIVIDDNDLGDDYEMDSPEAISYGRPVGISMRETIPCAFCGQECWDDEDNAHVATGYYDCSKVL